MATNATAYSYDPAMLGLAVMLAAITCITAVWFALLALGARGHARVGWLLAAAGVCGIGFWGVGAAHLLALFSFKTIAFEVPLSLAALLLATAFSGLGFSVAVFARTKVAVLVGGGIFGLGVTSSQLALISALQAPALAVLDWGTSSASAVLATAGSVVAFALGSHRRLLSRPMAAGLATTAILLAMYPGTLGTAAFVAHSVEGPARAVITGYFVSAAIAVAAAVLPTALSAAVLHSRSQWRRSRDDAARLRTLANAAREGICIHADGRMLDVNVAFAEIVGVGVEDCVGASPLDFVAPDHRHRSRAAIAEGREAPYEVDMQRPDGGRVPVEISGRAIEFEGHMARVSVVRNLTTAKQAEERIRYLAHHDGLTGLANRALFHDRLDHALAQARQSGEPLAVLSFNIDRFRRINEVYGSAFGDGVLQEAAEALAAQTSAADTLARTGGDEFALIQCHSPRPGSTAALAEHMLAIFSDAFGPRGRNLDITLSIGIAIYPQDGRDGESLMKSANVAVRRARDDGGDRYRFYETALDERLRLRQALERDLRQALAEDALSVHYQPQADVATGRIVGVEALARWQHPTMGMVMPGDFIAVAEECGLIATLGESVLRKACADAAEWPEPLQVAVNLSAEQFKKGDIAGTVESVLDACGLDPARLELEITETALIEDSEAALVTFDRLKALGVHIAMDDFGTGYSSLGYLQRFAFDTIKIDRSFVKELDSNSGSLAITRTIIGLGRTLGLKVVAEGVEREAELETLRREGCDLMQGYLLSPPVPLAELAGVIARATQRMTDGVAPSASVTPLRPRRRR